MAHALTKTIGLLTVLAIIEVPIAARADHAADAKAEAKKHFDRAMELNEDGQVAEAVVELKRCYEISPHPAVLYSLGQAYITLAKPVEAVAALQRYLDEGGKAIKAARRAEVEQDLARQKSRIATLEIRVLPDGASVCLDGDDIGKAPLGAGISIGIGEHVVSATAEGHDPAEVKVTVAGEDRKTIELTLTALPEKKPEPVAAPPPPLAPPNQSPPAPQLPYFANGPEPWLPADLAARPAPTMPEAVASQPPSRTDLVAQQPAPPSTDAGVSGLRIAGWVGVGLGIVGLGVGAVTGLVASSKNDDLDKKCPNRSCGTDLQAEVNQYNNLKTASTVGLVAGGICTVAGLVLLWTGSSDGPPKPPSVAFGLGPRSAQVRVSF